MTHIAVIGAWHNAHVTAACLAQLGHKVTLVNPSPVPWTSYPRLDVVEPGLKELVSEMRKTRLDYANLYPAQDDIEVPADIAWLAIDTPLRDDGSPVVDDLTKALVDAQERFPDADTIVISSQVPVGYCAGIEKLLGKPVVYVPENMQLGDAVNGFMYPDRLVVGSAHADVGDEIVKLMRKGEWSSSIMVAHRQSMVIHCDLPTAEMIKHATNAFLATSISLANELASVGELYGADNQLVAKAMRMDSRIGPRAYVRPGLGFAGGTLPRDLHAMLNVSSGCLELPLIEAVLRVNEDVVERIAKTTVSLCPPAPRTVCIMGYTYKAETDALRCSPVRQLVRRIKEIGLGSPYAQNTDPPLAGYAMHDRIYQDVNVVGYDPRFDGRRAELAQLATSGQFGWAAPWHMPVWKMRGTTDVFVVVTPLPEFKNLDWNEHGNGVVYDLCNGVDREAVLDAGLTYKAIWQPAETRHRQ